jgi:hypothetical protein
VKLLCEQEIRLTPEMMLRRTYRKAPNHPRTSGVHVQAVNKYLGIAAGKLSDSDADDYPFERFSDAHYPLLPAIGVVWEELRASMYGEDDLIWQPGELERDGIYGTPDGLLIPPAVILPGVSRVAGQVLAMLNTFANWECKATTKKLQPITSCWMYMKQGLSYCAMSGHRHVLYDVLWLCGDYSRPIQPRGTSSLVEFTDQEVEGWWAVVVKNKGNVRAE